MIVSTKTEMERKMTPPALDAQLAISDKGNLFVVIDSHNLIPFRARWMVVTEQNIVVNGIMLQNVECYPTSDTKRWKYKEDIKPTEVKNNFVELRFRYESTYYAELNRPEKLRGEIVHRYQLVEGAPRPID